MNPIASGLVEVFNYGALTNQSKSSADA